MERQPQRLLRQQWPTHGIERGLADPASLDQLSPRLPCSAQHLLPLGRDPTVRPHHLRVPSHRRATETNSRVQGRLLDHPRASRPERELCQHQQDEPVQDVRQILR